MSIDNDVAASGRPGAGAVLAADMDLEAARRPKQRDMRPLGRLIPFIRAHWGDAAMAGIFLLLSTSATAGLTFALRWMADRGIASHSALLIGRYFGVLAFAMLALALCTAARFFFITKLGERVVADLRSALYGHVVTLDQGYFLTTRTGEVLSRMTTDLTLVESMVGSTISIVLRNFLTVVIAMILMVFVNPGLTGWVVVLAALILAPLFGVGRQVRRLSIKAQERFADAIGYAGETLDALDTVQAFGRERRASERFKAAVEAAFRASLSRITVRAGMTGLVMILVMGGIGLILWRASLATFVDHSMTAGALLQFVVLSILAAGGVGSLGEAWGDVQKTSGAMARIAELLDAVPGIAAPARPRALPTPALGAIDFDQVEFRYPGRPELPALNGFSLSVRPGERVALVGPSGAGKSTVFRLLLRFYDPVGGAVRLDGVDLREVDPAEVRARIALVAQDAPLFSGSAVDNLRFGREDATTTQIAAALRAAEADGFLERLPQGLDTALGERAKTLSGGQRQRVAIARALVRDAPILLLDEATSALDAENERLVQRALHDAMSGRTTLVIAHRLATVLKADRIVVMDEGRAVESGTHAELSARGGLYAKLAKLQFGMEAA